MRVLVTRPEAEASRTARALQDLGHDPVVLPLLRVSITHQPLPEGRFDALAATSANAFSATDFPQNLRQCPLFAVGNRTAEAAVAAGFPDVRTGAGTASALAGRIVQDIGPDADLLFLAGTPRKPDLEAALSEAGIRVHVCETYNTLPVEALDYVKAFPVDAVLHYSRASAERFAVLVRAGRLGAAQEGVVHLCLSRDVSLGLGTLPDARILIAERPDEVSLFALLNISRSGPTV